jgi:hypothetical protein
MKLIKTSLFIEEIISLIKGKTIDYYEDDNIKVQISGKDLNISENKAILMKKILDMNEKDFNNLIDIIERYDNPEYYNNELNNE